jgi:hypothetical protein
MKKILVLLLIFSVAGGVFAQDGTWSVNGSVDIGARIDLDPRADKLEGDPLVPIIKSGRWDGGDPARGNLNLSYNQAGLSAGIGFEATESGNNGISLNFQYSRTLDNGDSYGMRASSSLRNFTLASGGAVGDLWGYYKFLQGLINLDVAFNQEPGGLWTSDTSIWDGKAPTNHDFFSGIIRPGTIPTYEKKNFLRAYINLADSGVNFGAITYQPFPTSWQVLLSSDEDRLPAGGDTSAVTIPWQNNMTTDYLLHDGILQTTVVGLQIDRPAGIPFKIAAQYRPRDYAVYFGGQYFLDSVTIGISFLGVLESNEEAERFPRLSFGGSVSYSQPIFGVTLKGNYYVEDQVDEIQWRRITVEPSVWVQAVQNYLRIELDTMFRFNSKLEAGEVVELDPAEGEYDIVWKINPKLTWSFRGDGNSNTGIFLGYGLESYAYNRVDLGFRWNFF